MYLLGYKVYSASYDINAIMQSAWCSVKDLLCIFILWLQCDDAGRVWYREAGVYNETPRSSSITDQVSLLTAHCIITLYNTLLHFLMHPYTMYTAQCTAPSPQINYHCLLHTFALHITQCINPNQGSPLITHFYTVQHTLIQCTLHNALSPT